MHVNSMHGLHVTILQDKFVYSSNQERCQLKSTVEDAHSSFRMKFGTQQMTTTVLIYIYIHKKKNYIVKILCNSTHGCKLLL